MSAQKFSSMITNKTKCPESIEVLAELEIIIESCKKNK